MQKVQVAYKDIVLPGAGPNEEYLASLRNQLKDLEAQGQELLLEPAFSADDCKDVEKALQITADYKHCARRVKDCASVKGFVIPQAFKGMERGAEIIENFKSELLEKHPHYIFED